VQKAILLSGELLRESPSTVPIQKIYQFIVSRATFIPHTTTFNRAIARQQYIISI